MYKKCAERDGKIDCGEKVGMAVNSFSSGVMTIVDFAMLIWGSVVVFGSWPDWTSEDVTSQDYCKDLPMHFAFGILVTAWVSNQYLIPT